MKTREEIKLQAKANMSGQRAAAVLITLSVWVIIAVFSLVGRIPIIGWPIAIAGELLSLVLSVSVAGAYISIYKGERTSAGTVIAKCGVNPLRKAGGMLWMGLFTFLWSLLFTIPGIVKAFAYSMTPYILADCPDVTATQALKLSMRMTKGHKGELFVAGLSFIGWVLLCPFTLGILYLFHVGPYISATMAGYYEELKKEALAKGVVKPEEFGLMGWVQK